MNNILRLALLLAFLCGAGVLRAERFSAATWAGVQSYEVAELRKLDRLQVGQLVAIKFNYRHERIRHLKPNWYQGSLWGYAPAGKDKFSVVQVMVPKDALPAYKAIPTDFKSAGDSVAYGQVLQDSEAAKFRFIRLMGTKLERDTAGNATVGW
jgi:hypothetical protein